MEEEFIAPLIEDEGWRFLQDWAEKYEMINQEEKEDSPFLTKEEISQLKKYPHVFDYSFSETELKFLDEKGYLVLKQIIPIETCDRMVEEIVERGKLLYHLDQQNYLTWKVVEGDGFLDIWHNPAYYEIRQNPKLYSIFAQLLREPNLVVSLDRICLKPPSWIEIEENNIKKKIEFHQTDFKIHNDMNLWKLEEPMYQGGLALNDCPVGGGGFRCIPGFHKLQKIQQYRNQYEQGIFHMKNHLGIGPQPPPVGSFNFFLDRDMIKQETKEIPLEKGDFIIWNSRLPHSNTPNWSTNWRIHCYVRYMSAKKYDDYLDEVRECMNTGRKPRFYSTGYVGTGSENRTCEMPYHQKPKLTWLGERLLGEKPWEIKKKN